MRGAPGVPRCERNGIVFLCQQCHGDLEPTGEQFAGDRVWRCLSCSALWIYTLAGWGRIPERSTHVGTGAPPIDAEL